VDCSDRLCPPTHTRRTTPGCSHISAAADNDNGPAGDRLPGRSALVAPAHRRPAPAPAHPPAPAARARSENRRPSSPGLCEPFSTSVPL
jgi:hypothetical protein